MPLGQAATKALIGGGLGALGGALAQDPADLWSFVRSSGQTGIPGIGSISVDPGDFVAQGAGRTGLVFDDLADLAAQPTEIGPAAMAQTPAFAFGGTLPAPVGVTVADPGFLQRPGSDIFAGLETTPVRPRGDGVDGLRPPLHGGHLEVMGGGGGASTRPFGGEGTTKQDLVGPALAASSRGGLPLAPGGLGAGLGAPLASADFNPFITAMNLLTLGRRPPIVRGGFG